MAEVAIYNLNKEWDEVKLKGLIEPIAKIQRVRKIIANRRNKIGIVELQNKEEMRKAMDGLVGKEINEGEKLEVIRCNYIPMTTCEEQFAECCRKYCEFSGCEIEVGTKTNEQPRKKLEKIDVMKEKAKRELEKIRKERNEKKKSNRKGVSGEEKNDILQQIESVPIKKSKKDKKRKAQKENKKKDGSKPKKNGGVGKKSGE